MGRGEPTTGIKPFGRLGHQGLAQEPSRAGPRLFCMVDHGSSPRGEPAKQRLYQVDSRLSLGQPPVHASGLKQGELYGSIIPRKVLTPNDFANLEAIQRRLAWYDAWAHQRPTPLQGKFDRTALVTLLAKIEAHHKRLSNTQSACTAEAA